MRWRLAVARRGIARAEGLIQGSNGAETKHRGQPEHRAERRQDREAPERAEARRTRPRRQTRDASASGSQVDAKRARGRELEPEDIDAPQIIRKRELAHRNLNRAH